MKRSLALMVSAGFFLCLAFTGCVDAGRAWAVPAKCRTQQCDKINFDAVAQNYCVLPFKQNMETSDYQFNCPWPATRRYYAELMMCLETLAKFTCCMHVSYRNRLLMEIHELYFSICSDTYLKDPAVPVLLLLTVPCIIVPFIIPFLWQRFKLHEYKLPNTH
ncbi:uncharacterized protein isoform X1 [Danio rerio]|uniref:Uncharacterized protein isoform X1 n=3 Tax=Danio rerio TaxID=7955 RepID=A0AC58GD35_DANRE|nr:uncharacterized protein LOC101930740 precursor [Danio rerio]